MRPTSLPLWLCLPVALLASACSDSATAPDTSLTVRGSGGAPPALSSSRGFASRRAGLSFTTAGVSMGDPGSILIGMYALSISPNPDCSAAVKVQDYGATAESKDFVANPILFTGTPDAGSYHCVVIKMSDAIDFTSASTFGTCTTGVLYHQDIYRDGETDWKDVDLVTIIGHGTDESPVDDHVSIVMTTDTSAAIGRGFSTHQVIRLESPLVVPGSSTFYWNAAGSVTTEDGWPCGLQPGRPTFE
jgi:hypothetical protein